MCLLARRRSSTTARQRVPSSTVVVTHDDDAPRPVTPSSGSPDPLGERAGESTEIDRSLDDPPSVPPFASTGPRPPTIAGIPAEDIFGGGDVDGLFAPALPKLGPTVATPPVPKIGPPPLVPEVRPVARAAAPPLPPSPPAGLIKPPTTRVAPLAPPTTLPSKPSTPPPKSIGELAKSAEPAGVAKPSTTPASQPEPPVEAAAPAIKSLADLGRPLSDDERFELEVGLVDEAELLRKILAKQAAERGRASAGPQQAAADRSEASPTHASREAERSEKIEKSERAERSEKSEPAVTREPIATLEPVPMREPIASLVATLEPVSIVSRESESTPSAIRSLLDDVDANASSKRTESTEPSRPWADTGSSNDDGVSSLLQAQTASEAARASEAAVAHPDASSEDGPTIMHPRSARIALASLDTSPSKSPLAPPPPRSTSTAPAQAQLGAPYEPPAVILRDESPSAPASELDDDAESSTDTREPEPPHSPTLPEPSALRRPGRLPAPDRPPVAPAPATAERIIPKPTMIMGSSGVPTPMPKQDTGALIDGLANELVAEAQRETAVTIQAKTPARVAAEARQKRNKRLAWAFVAVAAAAIFTVALLPDDPADSQAASDVEPTRDEPAPEPSAPQPDDRLALADPTPEAPEPALAGSEAGEAAAVPSEPEAVEPEPEPAAPELATTAAGPSKKKSTTKTETKTETKSATTSTSKSEPALSTSPSKPTSPTDNRSAKELYDAAKSAYDKGQAGEAYKLAFSSWRKQAKPKTAELMTLAACKLKDSSKAKGALDKVASLRRGAIRKQCKSLGLSI